MSKSNKEIIIALVLLVSSMIILSFASVPIYNLFCKATGFGGTVQQKAAASNKKGYRQITINFDANLEPGLPWKFVPKQKSINVTTGTNSLVFYHLHNMSNKDIVGTAIYNITPNKAGKYFVKIYCFCFEEQIIKKYDEMLMPVSFYIDPAIEDDPYMHDVYTITLSYSFFKIRDL